MAGSSNAHWSSSVVLRAETANMASANKKTKRDFNGLSVGRALLGCLVAGLVVGVATVDAAHAQTENALTRWLAPWLGGAGNAPPAPAGDDQIQLAQQKKQAPQAEGNQPAVPSSSWAVNCTNLQGGFVCEMTQAIVDSTSRSVIMLISIKRSPDQPSTAALFRSAHGVYLPAGLSVQVDSNKPVRLEFQKSDNNGVYAALPLDNQLVTDFKRGREVTLETELNKGQKFTLKAPLNGFPEAYDRVMSTK